MTETANETNARILKASGKTYRQLAAFLGLTENEFWQKRTGYRGRHFDGGEIVGLIFCGVDADELVPPAVREVKD
jgi:hypothetical protein